MIKLFDINDESVRVDLFAPKAAGYEGAWARSRKYNKDDQQLSQNRTALGAAGYVYGLYADFDYRGVAAGGQSGKDQGDAFGGAYRADPLLPPAIRLWPIDGVPTPSMDKYATLLSEVLYYTELISHRKPGIMANMSTLKALVPYLNLQLSAAWICVIYPSSVTPKLDPPYTKFPFWMKTLYTQSIPGASKVADMAWPGDIAGLKKWASDPTNMSLIPAWDATTPNPGGDPGGGGTGEPGTPAPAVDLTGVISAIDANTLELKTVNENLVKLMNHLGAV